MSRGKQIAEGITRIVQVTLGVIGILGTLVIYSINAPRSGYAYTDSLGIYHPAVSTPFNISGFIIGVVILTVVLYLIYLAIIYIISGFSSPSRSD